MKNLKGVIFDTQRFSIHDGPGIRTTVFLKGCSLQCFWCHNPEGLSKKKQIQFTESLCIYCGACVLNCPEGAQEINNRARLYSRDRCIECGECVQHCYSDALIEVGKTVGVEDVMLEIVADKIFYDNSGGGVTLSGGEPALQPEFASAILQACVESGIHTAIETSGNVPWNFLEKLVDLSNLVMMDLKHMDDEMHRKVTGVSNCRILENAVFLVNKNKPIIFRTPIVPNVNDNQKDIKAIADFIRNLIDPKVKYPDNDVEITWELLPFHKLASDKYKGLGLVYKANNTKLLEKDKIYELLEVAQSAGVPVKISS